MAHLIINPLLNRILAESSTASLPDEAKVYAKMSQQAYKSPDRRDPMIGGFKYLQSESDQFVGVYYLENRNWIIIAIKGTGGPDGMAKEVLTDDLRILMGETAFRTVCSRSATEIAREVCPSITGVLTRVKGFFESLQTRLAGKQATIHVTGHSLGGWVAIELAKEFKHAISGGHVFNAGSSATRRLMDPAMQKVWRWWTDDRISHGNFHHHHIVGDILSSEYHKIGGKQTTNYHGHRGNDPRETHTIKNFSEEYDKNPVSLW